jgi:hypothetical protein
MTIICQEYPGPGKAILPISQIISYLRDWRPATGRGLNVAETQLDGIQAKVIPPAVGPTLWW